MRVRLVPVVVEGQVLGEREVEDDAASLVDPPGCGRGRIRAGPVGLPFVISVSASLTRPSVARLRPVSASSELRLAVAVDARDSHDLAGAHVEADAAHRRETAIVARP